MLTPTDDQITDLRADLGIGDDGAVFTDAELGRLFARAEGAYDLTVVYAIKQLLMDAAKFNDYTAGSSSEKKSQVFDHLQQMHELWARQAGVAGGVLSAGVIDLDFMEKGD